MRKLLLATTLSALLVACGGNEHGPNFGNGGGSQVDPEKPENEIISSQGGLVTSRPSEDNWSIINSDLIKRAKEGDIITLKVGDDIEFDVNFTNTNKDGHHTSTNEKGERTEIYMLTGNDSLVGVFRSQQAEGNNKNKWQLILANSADRYDNQLTEGSAIYTGKALAVANENDPQSAIGIGELNATLNFTDATVEGSIKGEDKGIYKPFGENGVISFDGTISSSSWVGSAWDNTLDQKGNANNKTGFVSGNILGDKSSEINGHYQIDGSSSGVFIGNKTK